MNRIIRHIDRPEDAPGAFLEAEAAFEAAIDRFCRKLAAYEKRYGAGTPRARAYADRLEAEIHAPAERAFERALDRLARLMEAGAPGSDGGRARVLGQNLVVRDGDGAFSVFPLDKVAVAG